MCPHDVTLIATVAIASFQGRYRPRGVVETDTVPYQQRQALALKGTQDLCAMLPSGNDVLKAVRSKRPMRCCTTIQVPAFLDVLMSDLLSELAVLVRCVCVGLRRHASQQTLCDGKVTVYRVSALLCTSSQLSRTLC